MDKMLTLLVAVFIAGCAAGTAIERQQMPDKDPVAQYVTDKPLPGVAECVESAVRAVANSGHTVSAMDDGAARIVWVTTLANPVIAVRMEPSETGTRVEYRSRYQMGFGNFANAVMSCR